LPSDVAVFVDTTDGIGREHREGIEQRLECDAVTIKALVDDEY
jgi:hypothetical protein